MTRAERFMSVWIENNGYQYDNFPVGECMQSYADHQLKAKMPSCENLRNLVYGGKLNPYQRKLALGEFEQILKT